MVETLDLVAKPAAAVDVVQLEEDLLSSNDKALQPKQNGNGGRGGQQQHQPRSRFTTKGKLSIGSDDISRVMIVSCEGESLMEIGMHDNTVATRVGDNFHFTCEFPSGNEQAAPQVFQADAEDQGDAIRAVLAQVRDWDRGAIR